MSRLKMWGVVTVGAYGALAVASRLGDVSRPRIAALHAAALLVATIAGLVVGARAMRDGDGAVSEREARLALGFAVASALACASALPVTSRDFWYYIGAGRLADGGANVFMERLSHDAMAGLPLASGVYPNMTMPYGPAWVAVSRVLSRVAGGSPAIEFALFKALMLAAWSVACGVAFAALRESPARQLRLALWMGWLPLVPFEVLVNGHNDIVMVALLTVWLAAPGVTTVWALVLSAVVKYVTAPLIGVAALDAMVRRSTRTMISLAVALAAAAWLLWANWNDGALVVEWRATNMWELFTPVALIRWTARSAGLPAVAALLLTMAWRAAMVVFVLIYGWRHARGPTPSSLAAFAGATVLAMLSGSHYLLPWYFTWLVPALLLTAETRLLTLALPFMLVMPFLDVFRQLGTSFGSHGRLTVLLYAAVAAVAILGRAVRAR